MEEPVLPKEIKAAFDALPDSFEKDQLLSLVEDRECRWRCLNHYTNLIYNWMVYYRDGRKGQIAGTPVGDASNARREQTLLGLSPNNRIGMR